MGLKPTWGRVSRHGVVPLAETLDHVGPLARSVEDAAALLGAIAGPDDRDPTSAAVAVPDYLKGIGRGVQGLRVGIDRAFALKGVDTEVRKAIERALRVLKSEGAEIVSIKLPPLDPAVDAWAPICSAEAALAHAATYPSRKRGYSATYAAFLDAGRAVTGMEYAQAVITRKQFQGAMQAVFQSIDLMITPVVGNLNWTVAGFDALCAEEGGLRALIACTCVDDMTGAPTITLPAGLDCNGSPLAFQLVGRHFEEALLFRAGRVWQSAADWRGLRPPLSVL